MCGCVNTRATVHTRSVPAAIPGRRGLPALTPSVLFLRETLTPTHAPDSSGTARPLAEERGPACASGPSVQPGDAGPHQPVSVKSGSEILGSRISCARQRCHRNAGRVYLLWHTVSRASAAAARSEPGWPGAAGVCGDLTISGHAAWSPPGPTCTCRAPTGRQPEARACWAGRGGRRLCVCRGRDPPPTFWGSARRPAWRGGQAGAGRPGTQPEEQGPPARGGGVEGRCWD